MAKKKPTGEQLSLGKPKVSLPEPPVAAPIEAAPMEPPKILEYTPATALERWQVEKFEILAAYFGLIGKWEDAMARFHGFAEADTQRWFYVRRLFGIMPLIPTANMHPDDLKVWTREELCERNAITKDQLTEELTHLRIAWEGWQTEQSRTGNNVAMTPAEKTSSETLQFGEDLLEKFNFEKSLFEVEMYDSTRPIEVRSYKRAAEKNRQEMNWFIEKLLRPEWQKMLSDPLAGPMARMALINELYLRRFDMEMMQFMPTHPKWKELSVAQKAIQSQYQDQMDSLAEKFPELGVAGRVSFRAVISDLNLAHRQYYGKKDNRLWDRIHTSSEIVFLNRTSAQLPQPRYRLSWHVAVVEAMHGLYDPNFRSQLRKPDLKRLDLGYRRGVEEAKREMPEPEVNLEKGVIPGEPDCDEFEDYLVKEPVGN
jgi:hypothetical protein